MLDHPIPNRSSLASNRQLRSFLKKQGPEGRAGGASPEMTLLRQLARAASPPPDKRRLRQQAAAASRLSQRRRTFGKQAELGTVLPLPAAVRLGRSAPLAVTGGGGAAGQVEELAGPVAVDMSLLSIGSAGALSEVC